MKKLFVVLFVSGLVIGNALANPADPSEEFPAGSGTTEDFSTQAFSHPLSGTRSQLRRDFNVGNSFFNNVWVSSPSSTTLRDGLGPNYNAVACSACHFKDGRGHGLPDAPGPIDVSLLIRLRVKNGPKEVIPHPSYGGQFQPMSIPGVPNEGTPIVSYEKVTGVFSDGEGFELLKPIYQFIDLHFGPMGENAIISPRVAPQMIGLGLLEAIPTEDIVRNEDPYDADGNGISGRANHVYSLVLQKKVIGRFGWKAGQPSVLEQSAAAFNGDMGITNPLYPVEACTEVETDCLARMTKGDIAGDRLNLVATYAKLLAPPKRRNFESIEVNNGREHFYQANCIGCHTPGYTTGTSDPIEVLQNQKIYPYTDLLLHDMGPALADNLEEYFNEEEASTFEWRTPPLWGLGLVSTVNGHTHFLHDGRARNLEEAILWHGGEAENAKKAYLNLNATERSELLKFLESL